MKRAMLIKTIKLIFCITKLDFKGLERSIGNMGAKKGHYLMFSIRFWHSKREYVIFKMF
jgi:hypothetical protein